MDFSTFKSITIDGNAITKIEIGGNTVWQEDTGTTEEYSGLTCVFNITETGSTFLGYGNNHPSTIIVDGTEESWSSYYNFTTTGEHIVKFPYSYLAGRNFQDVQALTSVHIGSGCTKMSGRNYFKNCENLTAITVSDKSTIYDSRDNCNAIIKTSTNTMVQGCKTTTIPSTVTAIGEAAFAEIPITAITIPENVTSLEDWALCGTDLVEVTIPSTVTSYGIYIFEDCSKLEKITTPSLGYSFCHECTSLKEVVFSNASISYINERAFEDCTSLTSITIPNSVTSIGDSAFNNTPWYKSYSADTANQYGNIIYINNVAYQATSTGITSCEFKEGTVSISIYTFNQCTSLTSVVIPDSVTSIGNKAFYECTGLTSVTIGNSVTSIGYYAFYNCISLTSVTIGNSVTSIGYCTFYQCTGLTSVVIPNSVTSIGYYAFNGCSGLTSVTIPDSVTSISDSAFYQCTKLETITYNGTVAQWETITKGSSWNDSVPATKVTCSDGEVTL